MSTKVCPKNFVRGYRTSECSTPTLYIKEYDFQIYRDLVYEDDSIVLVECGA